MSGCNCGLVQAYMAAEKKKRGVHHDFTEMRTWTADVLDRHMADEETFVFPEIVRRFPDRKPDVDALLAVHAAFRRHTAQGRMPSATALLAHAMAEDRLLRETGLGDAYDTVMHRSP